MPIFIQLTGRRFYLLLTLFIFSGIHTGQAQENWRSAGTLLDNRAYRINVEFLLPASVQDIGQPARFRYRVLRVPKEKNLFIYWRFDYLNYNNELMVKDVKLQLGKSNQTGLLEDSAFVFPGYKVINDPYAVLASERSLIRQAVKAVSPYSVEPRQINGESTVDKGGRMTLSLAGGYLASGARWRWYEGECAGRFIDTGWSIRVMPLQNTTYYVRAEGRNNTACVSFPVKVVVRNQAATAVTGSDLICDNERNVQLSVTGGRLGDEGKWVWYESGCDGRRIGEGPVITVSPTATTTYAVRSEGPTNITECLSHTVRVTTASRAAAAVAGPETITRGGPAVLSVTGGLLAEGARWVWYTGSPNALQPAGSGSVLTVYPDKTATYYVRAEGLCNVTGFAARTVRVKSPRQAHPPVTFFLNAGVVSDDLNKAGKSGNLVFTLGGGGQHVGAYVRAKVSTNQSRPDLQTNGDGYINDYNRPGYYYAYNGRSVSKHSAYTGGMYLGGQNIAIYLGGGYGRRQLLAGIDQFPYGMGYYDSTDSWVKNLRYNYQGWEAEGGLLLRAGLFNLMGGVSSLQGKYTDFHLGAGLTF